MRRLAKWHIWLGWLIAVPLLMWTISGLVMVVRPIEEVRGKHLRLDAAAQLLPVDRLYTVRLPARAATAPETATIRMDGGSPVTTVTYADGAVLRIDAAGKILPALREADARRLVARSIKGGTRVASVRFFPANQAPTDFRRPVPVWQVSLESGTRVYVGQQTGAIEAVRTPYWRLFDFMWGLHIMDLSGREDTHHPVLVLFTALAAVSVVIGTALLFRRRKARR